MVPATAKSTGLGEHDACRVAYADSDCLGDVHIYQGLDLGGVQTLVGLGLG